MSEWVPQQLSGCEGLTAHNLSSQGLHHLFCGKGVLEPRPTKDEYHTKLAARFPQVHCYSPTQVHGVDIWDATELSEPPPTSPEADAVCIQRSQSGSIIAIQTADCLPIIISGSNYCLAVHAGWRGLASGIIERSINFLISKGDYPNAIAVGPSAGSDCYEVGSEVIEAAQPLVKFKTGTQSGKFILDLPGSAELRIRSVIADSCSVLLSPVSTMLDKTFHSFRRDGINAGRNITFVSV